jgi:hypothetical protein
LLGFSNGEIPADVFVRLLVDEYHTIYAVTPNITSGEEPLDDSVYAGVKSFLCLLIDVERRLCAQLSFFRMYPKIFTPCCMHEHCFMCKVEGHHEGETCEEVSFLLPLLLLLLLPLQLLLTTTTTTATFSTATTYKISKLITNNVLTITNNITITILLGTGARDGHRNPILQRVWCANHSD